MLSNQHSGRTTASVSLCVRSHTFSAGQTPRCGQTNTIKLFGTVQGDYIWLEQPEDRCIGRPVRRLKASKDPGPNDESAIMSHLSRTDLLLSRRIGSVRYISNAPSADRCCTLSKGFIPLT